MCVVDGCVFAVNVPVELSLTAPILYLDIVFSLALSFVGMDVAFLMLSVRCYR